MRPRTTASATRLVLGCLVLLTALTATSCASTSDPIERGSATDTGATAQRTAVVDPAVLHEALDDRATLIDVRTPAEFDAGHLPDATNIDLASPDFEARIEQLDPSASYVVYCASGNRAGQAVAHMLTQGFTNTLNGGGYESLSRTLPPDHR